jgi:Xaa-Pro aminopeptidase
MNKFAYASTKNSDLLYLLKHQISDPVFYLSVDKQAYVFLDKREFGVFLEKPNGLKVIELEPFVELARKDKREGLMLHKIALNILEKFVGKVAVLDVPNYLPIDMADFLRSKKYKLNVIKEFAPGRRNKSSDEKNEIKKNLKKTQKAFRKIEEILKQSRIKGEYVYLKGKKLTSEYIKGQVEMVLLKEGLVNIDGIIISCANQSAIPHHSGGGPIFANTSIICDIFPRNLIRGYFADMTRTYVKGKPTSELGKMYLSVKKAQEVAIKMIKNGANAKSIHEQVVTSFEKDGFLTADEGFVHSTGHGLGLDVHEMPSIGSYTDYPLKTGDVVTVEPGLYYRKIGGVRIEDVVYVTKNGCENLTNYRKVLVIP